MVNLWSLWLFPKRRYLVTHQLSLSLQFLLFFLITSEFAFLSLFMYVFFKLTFTSMIFGFGGLGLMDYVDYIGYAWGLRVLESKSKGLGYW
jgi:hypothetical protein